MTQLSDDLRFQVLPPDEIRERIRKSFDKAGWKYIFIEETNWYNATTRCKHNIYNIPIYASMDCSERPRLVTEVTVMERSDENSSFTSTAHYVYNVDYVHHNIGRKYNRSTNAHSNTSGCDYVYDYENTNIQYRIEFESFCNPITMHHFYITDLKDLTLLFKGQLMGQNKGSPLRSIDSVAGTYDDVVIRATEGGGFIKRSAPIIQLLSKTSLMRLQNANRLAEILQNNIFPTGDLLAYKLLKDDKYVIGNKTDYEKAVKNKQVSAYYPVITAEMCKDLIENIPRVDIDFGCFGLGSAGTGVLDLLSRSTFFEKYFLTDFDRVESKNLRNQWYTNREISYNKAQASATIFRLRLTGDRHVDVSYKTSAFEDINFALYNFKYVMAAFDSIDTRLNFLNKILEEKSQAKYLIDARYDDLTASLFFIDLEKEDEIDFYRKGLLADKEVFDKIEAENFVKNKDQFIQYLENEGCFECSCGRCMSQIDREIRLNYEERVRIECPRNHIAPNESISCESDRCLKYFESLYDKYPNACNKFRIVNTESSCIRQNFMDIYHYASTFIFDAIRIIEDDKDKPFTQVDITTDPLPSSMILRR